MNKLRKLFNGAVAPSRLKPGAAKSPIAKDCTTEGYSWHGVSMPVFETKCFVQKVLTFQNMGRPRATVCLDLLLAERLSPIQICAIVCYC